MNQHGKKPNNLRDKVIGANELDFSGRNSHHLYEQLESLFDFLALKCYLNKKNLLISLCWDISSHEKNLIQSKKIPKLRKILKPGN